MADSSGSASLVKVLRSLWAELLDVDPEDISDEDSFFDLGGNSVTVADLVAKAQENHMILSAEQIYLHPTLAELGSETRINETSTTERNLEPFSLLPNLESGQVSQQLLVQEISQACTLTSQQILDIYPCSPMQQALFATSLWQKDSYKIQLCYEIALHTDLDRFMEAWESTVAACPILRTRIVSHESLGYLQVAVQEQIKWAVGNDLPAYLEEDEGLLFGTAQPLTRYAIVSSGVNGEVKRYFVWTLHHAICDAVSISECLALAAKEYNGQGPASDPADYRKFIRFVQASNSNETYNYWQQQLQDVRPTLFPRLPKQGYNPLTRRSITREINMNIEPRVGATRAIILRAAWTLLLSKLSDTHDIVYGAVSNGRSAGIEGIGRMTGPTLTTVPVRVKVDLASSIEDLFTYLTAQYAESLTYEQVGVGELRRRLVENGAGDCSFQTWIAVQSMEVEERTEMECSNMGLRRLHDIGKLENHSVAVAVVVTLRDQSYHLRLDFDPSVLDEKQAAIITYQLETTIDQLTTKDLRTPLNEISHFSRADETQIAQWNAVTPKRHHTTAHQLFEQQVQKAPSSPATIAWDGALSYHQLDKLAAKLAVLLTRRGVQAGDNVALCCEKSKWIIVGILGILKAGGAYVPLDPAVPVGRMKQIIEIANIRVGVSSQKQRNSTGPLCLDTIVIDNELPLDSDGESDMTEIERPAPAPALAPENAAYVLFTSGSTGTPKGVVMSHSALCTSMVYVGTKLQLDSSTRSLQFSSLAFDASVGEIFATLIFGGCICVPSDEERMNNLSLFIQKTNANLALLVPGVANTLVPTETPSLRTIVLGGEAPTKEVIGKWADTLRLINGFGPTETCVYCSMNADLVTDSDPRNIGSAVGSLRWIVESDDVDALAPIGCVGELVISGNTLANSYLGNETATRSAFVSELRWLKAQGATDSSSTKRVYKTGDLVYYNSDGSIQYMGRKDNQVKLRGLRIELGEIEARLSGARGFTSVVVDLPKIGPPSGQLVAVVCLESIEKLPALPQATELTVIFGKVSRFPDEYLASVKQSLKSQVPSYMIPTMWIAVQRFPILISDKPNRKAIASTLTEMKPETYQTLNQGTEPIDSVPSTETEMLDRPAQLIREAWSTVLNVPVSSIGPDTSFYDLGGDSVSAMQAVSKCRKLGLVVTVQSILEHKTISKLSNSSHAVTVTQQSTQGLDLGSVPAETRFPLSPIQQHFFHINGEKSPNLRYNQSLCLKLNTETAIGTLQGAISTVVQKHAMLRARVQLADVAWAQSFVADGPGAYRMAVNDPSTEAEVRLLMEEAHDSIDIVHGPVFSVDLLHTQTGTLLYMVAHHMVIDLVSWRIILQEIEDVVRGLKIQLHEPVSFPNWISELNRHTSQRPSPNSPTTANEAIRSDLWGLSQVENDHQYGAKLEWSLNASQTSSLLNEANGAFGTEPVELMLAALLYSFTQTFEEPTPPTVFLEGHGRQPWDPRYDLSETVGWFTIMDPIALDLRGDTRIDSYVRAVKDIHRHHDDKGLSYFTKYARALLQEPTKEPRIQELQFNYHGIFQQLEREDSLFSIFNQPGVAIDPISPDTKRNSLLEVEASVHGETFTVSLEYHKLSKNVANIEKWMARYKNELESICKIFPQRQRFYTFADFPHFPVHDQLLQRLNDLIADTLVKNQGSITIEDAYACSPFQQDVLRNQVDRPSLFSVRHVFEISSRSQGSIDISRLENGWKEIVKRQKILRTVFVEQLVEGFSPVQVVLSDPVQDIITLRSHDDIHTNGDGAPNGNNYINDAKHSNNKVYPNTDVHSNGNIRSHDEPSDGSIDINEPASKISRVAPSRKLRLPHHLTLARTSTGSIVATWEASHAVLDGWSLAIMKRDLLELYGGKPLNSTVPDYGQYVAHVQSSGKYEQSLAYWRETLSGQDPCVLSPQYSKGYTNGVSGPVVYSAASSIDTDKFIAFCRTQSVTLASLVDAAWARTLAEFTATPSVLFGQVVNAREVELPGTDELIGPMLSMLVCRASTELSAPQNLPAALQAQRIEVHGKMSCNVFDICKELGVPVIFNTAVNFQRRRDAGIAYSDLEIREVETDDPWNVSFETSTMLFVNAKHGDRSIS